MSPYIKQTRLVFEGLNVMKTDVKLRRLNLYFILYVNCLLCMDFFTFVLFFIWH